MVSLVIVSGKSQQKRDALLKDIGQQEFPAQALQVVLVSNKADAFKDLPEVNFELRTVTIKDKKHKTAMVDIAVRQCSGDFVYVLDEGAIFDNPNDLLKLYEFLLDNSGVDVCVGYNIEHHMYEPQKGPARIMKSSVLEMDGNSNICLRRKVIEGGFSFSRYLFADSAIEEIQEMGFTVDKLKWLQVHHKKSVPFFMVGVLRIQEWLVARWQRASQVPLVQGVQRQLIQLYHSEKIRRFSIRLRWWAQDLMMLTFKYSRLFWQVSKVYFLRFKVYSIFAWRRVSVALKYQWQLRYSQIRGRYRQLITQRKVIDKKIYVPHLESSDDRPGPPAVEAPKTVTASKPPLFKLKSPEKPEDLDI